MRHDRMVKTDFIVGANLILLAKLQAMALDPIRTRGPGLTGEEASQLAVQLAVLRETVLRGSFASFALYRNVGTTFGAEFVGIFHGDQVPRASGEFEMLEIYGNGPIDLAPQPNPGPGLDGPQWARKLALALDRCMVLILDSEQSHTVPPLRDLEGAVLQPVAIPFLLPLIVAGVAATVVATVAVWRYLDPTTRQSMAAVMGAAEGYKERIAVFKETGLMPPPSLLENAGADHVLQLAKKEQNSDWLWFAAGAGGTAVVTTAAGALRNA